MGNLSENVPTATPPVGNLRALAVMTNALEAEGSRSIEKRWTPMLAQRFCPVSSAFLELYHELRPSSGARCMNSTEAMLLIHLISYKWTEKPCFPTVGALSTRMGLSMRMVRISLKNLEESGYIRRDPMPNGGPNRYHFDGLFKALEALLLSKAQVAA